MAAYRGIAPVKQASGRSVWIHMRWACPKFLRQTFHELARTSLRFCVWAGPVLIAITRCSSNMAKTATPLSVPRPSVDTSAGSEGSESL
jgi:hypothetical protein